MSEPADDHLERQDDKTDVGRRQFLKVGVGVVGTGVACLTVAPAVGYLGFPLDAPVTSGGGEFVIVGRRGAFRSGEPVRVDVHADVIDAWNRVQNVRLGSVWVVEREGELIAFSTVCPHLGCSVDFDAEAGKFACPCHRSAFGLDGAREDGPSPRDLDRLVVKDENELVSVMYRRFRHGIETMEEI